MKNKRTANVSSRLREYMRESSEFFPFLKVWEYFVIFLIEIEWMIFFFIEFKVSSYEHIILYLYIGTYMFCVPTYTYSQFSVRLGAFVCSYARDHQNFSHLPQRWYIIVFCDPWEITS